MEDPTAEQLEKIEELAGLQFLPEQIGVIVGLDQYEFAEVVFKEEGEIYLRYARGQLLSEAEVRKSMLEMAKKGSVPAQKQVLEIIQKNKKQTDHGE